MNLYKPSDRGDCGYMFKNGRTPSTVMKSAMKKGAPSYGSPPTVKKKDTQCPTCLKYFRGKKGLFFHNISAHYEEEEVDNTEAEAMEGEVEGEMGDEDDPVVFKVEADNDFDDHTQTPRHSIRFPDNLAEHIVYKDRPSNRRIPHSERRA